MSDEQVARLTARIEQLKHHLDLIEEVDEALEQAMLHREPVAKTMARILEPARAHFQARALCLRTFDEEQKQVDFLVPDPLAFVQIDMDQLCHQVEAQKHLILHDHKEGIILGYRLDVTDVYLGSVLLVLDPQVEEDDLDHLQRALELWSEQVDNYLASIAQARRKHQALKELSTALRGPILDEGLNRALRILQRYVPYEDIALVLQYEEHFDRNTINYRIITRETWHSSTSTGNQNMAQDAIYAFIRGQQDDLLTQYQLSAHREDATILAADGHTPVGRISVGLDQTELTPFGRDILDRFADYIRLRVVDFSKEWKRLSQNFPQPIVRRLLQEADYYEKYLSPRDRHVAIMFCDIAGFTRLSEQVLREPSLIGKLIDTWGNKVVEFIWDTGGVFDKMVGDCIIGLWGPPYFEMSAQDACRAAADAAALIRDYTANIQNQSEFPELNDLDWSLGVSTGLNYSPLFVGTFGPDENYTGFSSGMNNTARLQGVASCHDILCMEAFVEAYGDITPFGSPQSATVKNVQHPLRYRALKKDPFGRP